MTSPAAGAARFVRAFLVSATTLTLAVTGHVAGGGHAPHPLALLVLLGVATTPAYLVARTRFGLPMLVGLLAVGQIGVHLVLTSRPELHDHGVGVMHGHEATNGGLVMVAAHLVATVLTAGLLTHADALLWSIWRLLSSALRLVMPTLIFAVRPPGRVLALGFVTPLFSCLLRRDADPRGPPLLGCPPAG